MLFDLPLSIWSLLLRLQRFLFDGHRWGMKDQDQVFPLKMKIIIAMHTLCQTCRLVISGN